jgi:hypothetical protein
LSDKIKGEDFMPSEKRCTCVNDFVEFYMENKTIWNPLKHHTKEDAATHAWQEILAKEACFFNKHGYIDILYDEKTRSYSRKKSMGRPTAMKRKESRITVRLSDEQVQALEIYCQTNSIEDKSVIIREAIMDYIK